MELYQENYRKVFAFLSKNYWSNQEEYDNDMGTFYDSIENHEAVFYCDPKGTLTLYDDEWFSPKTVDDTIDELDEDYEQETCFVCNWKDDEGNKFYTLLTKDDDENIIAVSRGLPMEGLDGVSPKLIDDGWKPICLKMCDGQRLYVWESPPKDAFSFIELYRTWVTQYSTEESDEDDETDEDYGSDNSTPPHGSTTDDATPRPSIDVSNNVTPRVSTDVPNHTLTR